MSSMIKTILIIFFVLLIIGLLGYIIYTWIKPPKHYADEFVAFFCLPLLIAFLCMCIFAIIQYPSSCVY